MKFSRLALMVLAATAFVACDRKTPAESSAAPTPAATPEPGYAGVATAEPSPTAPAAQPVAAAEVTEVAAPAEVNTAADNPENQLVKNEVLSRIDLMPKLSPEEKDKLYVLVDRARGMGKIVTIPFTSGKIVIGPKEVGELQKMLQLPQLKKFSDDPTVVFVVLGYADKKGDQQKNLALSLERADSVVAALKQKCGVMNVVHSVGMGSSEIFDAQNLDKNRVVEVWAVLP
jgi:outer membrane protein OmpA-like peptidoglycan-associated protein